MFCKSIWVPQRSRSADGDPPDRGFHMIEEFVLILCRTAELDHSEVRGAAVFCTSQTL